MDNGVRFTTKQLNYLSALVKKAAPQKDPRDEATVYINQGFKDAAYFISTLADPENMKRATQPGKLSE